MTTCRHPRSKWSDDNNRMPDGTIRRTCTNCGAVWFARGAVAAPATTSQTSTCQTGLVDGSMCGRPATHVRRNALGELRGSCAYHASSNYGSRAKRVA